MRKNVIIWFIAGLVSVSGLTVAAAAFHRRATPTHRPTTANSVGASAKKATPSAGQSVAQRIKNTVVGAISGVSKPLNILLIANNARNAKSPLSLGTGGGQADIMIVAHVDPTTHRVTLISVPRDTLVALPQWSVTVPKIKSVFTLGLENSPHDGPKMLMAAVSKLTGLPIHSYVVTDFQGFIDAINAVGGIKVDVRARLYDPLHSKVNLKPGLQLLNGKQALAYVRVRQNTAGNGYRINDFQRQQAEMQVLQILKHKLLNASTNPSKLLKLAHVWSKDVATNLSVRKLAGIGLAVSGSKVKTITLGSDRDSMDLAGFPLQGVNKQNYANGAYYDILNPAHIAQQLASYGSSGASTGLPTIPAPSSVTVAVYGSKGVMNALKNDGFTTIYLGPKDPKRRETVYYPTGKMSSGWAVGKALGAGNEWVAPSKKVHHVVVYAH